MADTRQLAAIMFSDIVGYTSLMGRDEGKALNILERNRDLQVPIIEKHKGKVLKEMGDGLLASFDSAVHAVKCAHEIQEAAILLDMFQLKIGLHLGDITFRESDVFGDGVNIASRLQDQARPGQVLISDTVYSLVKNQVDLEIRFIKDVNLKNVDEPVKIYQLGLATIPAQRTDKNKSASRNPISTLLYILIIAAMLTGGYFLYQHLLEDIDPTAVSLAVLPFKNMTGDDRMEPYCDGMTDAVISGLAKIGKIEKVISRTSMMSYKQSEKTIPEIARELKVSHVLESGFQMFGDSLIITLRLVDGQNDDLLWTETQKGHREKIFQVQAAVSEKVARKLNEGNGAGDINVGEEQLTSSLLAYEYFLRAQHITYFNYSYVWNEVDFYRAEDLLKKAIAEDPGFGEAYAALGDLYDYARISYIMQNRLDEFPVLLDSLRKSYCHRAYKLRPNSAFVNYAMTFLYLNREERENLDSGYFHARKALELEPGNALYPYTMGGFFLYAGLNDRAIRFFKQALNLDPLDHNAYRFTARAYSILGNNEEWESYIQGYFELTGRTNSRDYVYYLIRTGQFEKAGQMIEDLRSQDENTDFVEALWYAATNKETEALELLGSESLLAEEIYEVRLELKQKEEVFAQLVLWTETGFNFYQNLQNDPRYDTWREEQEFQAILEKARILNDSYESKYAIP